MAENLKGRRKLNTTSSDYNSLDFIISNAILTINTCELAAVLSVNEDNTLELKPLLNALSGNNTAVDTGTISNVPYFRLQGGKNAVKITPEIGDIGLVVYAQRDISSIKQNKRQSNPLSSRVYDTADGLFVGPLVSLNQEPVNFIEINNQGITINTGGSVVVNAASAEVNAPSTINGATTINGETTIQGTTTITGDVTVDGKLQASGDIQTDSKVTAQGEISSMIDVKALAISLLAHIHGGTQPGNGTTGVPQ